jgi:hypothetical protein
VKREQETKNIQAHRQHGLSPSGLPNTPSIPSKTTYFTKQNINLSTLKNPQQQLLSPQNRAKLQILKIKEQKN